MIVSEFLRAGARWAEFAVRSWVVAGGFVVLPFTVSAATGVSLVWDRSADSSVVGYNVYYGTSSRCYTNQIPVENATNATISNLQAGTTYYFAVTAYDSLGLESLPSDEVCCTLPSVRLAVQVVRTNGIPGAICITSGGPAAGRWTLEQSADLRTWSPCAAGTNGAVNVSFDTRTAPSLFFRLRSD